MSIPRAMPQTSASRLSINPLHTSFAIISLSSDPIGRGTAVQPPMPVNPFSTDPSVKMRTSFLLWDWMKDSTLFSPSHLCSILLVVALAKSCANSINSTLMSSKMSEAI